MFLLVPKYTSVFTDMGWVPIQEINQSHLIYAKTNLGAFKFVRVKYILKKKFNKEIICSHQKFKWIYLDTYTRKFKIQPLITEPLSIYVDDNANNTYSEPLFYILMGIVITNHIAFHEDNSIIIEKSKPIVDCIIYLCSLFNIEISMIKENIILYLKNSNNQFEVLLNNTLCNIHTTNDTYYYLQSTFSLEKLRWIFIGYIITDILSYNKYNLNNYLDLFKKIYKKMYSYERSRYFICNTLYDEIKDNISTLLGLHMIKKNNHMEIYNKYYHINELDYNRHYFTGTLYSIQLGVNLKGCFKQNSNIFFTG